MNIQRPKEYADQEVEFLGRKYFIDERAHIPRPSTEFIASHYIDSINETGVKNMVLADIGTGTGVLGIFVALNCKNVQKVYGTDLFADALAVAEINRQKFGMQNKVELLQGDLFEPIRNKHIDIILANLPFADDEKMKQLRPEVANFEPLTGIHGGHTGFELYEKLFEQLSKYQYFDSIKGLWIYCNVEHKSKVELIHKSLFHEFGLSFVEDKFKSYYFHCYFSRN